MFDTAQVDTVILVLLKEGEIMNRKKLQKRYDNKKDEKHVCIRIFDDETVFITDEKGQVLDETPRSPDMAIEPRNTYDQAMWECGSKICVTHRGKRRCYDV